MLPLLEPGRSQQLQHWLDLSLAFPPEYGDQLSSHLPMALHALNSLGADEARMAAFFSGYIARFKGRQAPSPGQVLPHWQAALGQFEAFADLRRSFETLLAEQGRDALLAQTLPMLLPGVSAVAFHGAIRTAHALESGHAGELVAALAYWASRWQALPGPAAPTPQRRTVAAWSQALVAESRSWRSEAPLIFLRMREATQTSVYAALAHGLEPSDDLAQRLALLARLALGYYLDSANFTVLHMITGLRALRVLLPYLPAELLADAAVQDLLDRSFVAAYLAGRVQVRASEGVLSAPAALNWPELAEAATRSSDDHAIKLVHACHAEMGVYGDTRYLQAAALALR